MTSYDRLRQEYLEQREEYPDLTRQLADGLLILLSGGVQETAPWRVATPAIYTVRLAGIPARWGCSCPQGKDYGTIVGDYLGRPGKICKHICAVTLGLESKVYPARPVSIYEYVSRMQAFDCPEWLADLTGKHKGIIALPNAAGVKAIPEGENLALKVGHKKSQPVVGDEAAYAEWVKEVSNDKG